MSTRYRGPTPNYLEDLLGQGDGKMNKLTAAQFMKTWKNYDRDGSLILNYVHSLSPLNNRNGEYFLKTVL